MKVDSEKAKQYFGEKPLTRQQITMLRNVLSNRMATWFIEKQVGKKLSTEDKKNILAYLEQEEKRMEQ